MRFYLHQHRFYCGIDLHARSMYVCIMDQSGKILLHRNYRSDPDAMLGAIAPYREDLVVAVECVFTWYWIADLCNREGIAFVLGHALYMKAIHGGKTKNDKIDSQKIASLLRSGMFPMALSLPPRYALYFETFSVAGCILPVNTQSFRCTSRTPTLKYNLPYFEKRIDRSSNRAGIGLRFTDLPIRTSVEVDAALMGGLHEQILTIERQINAQVPGHTTRWPFICYAAFPVWEKPWLW